MVGSRILVHLQSNSPTTRDLGGRDAPARLPVAVVEENEGAVAGASKRGCYMTSRAA